MLWGNLSNCTYLGIGNFFLWTIFSGRGHNMVRVQKWLLFLSPKFQFLAHKSEFCHMTPIFVGGPLLTLGMTVIIVLILVGKRISEPGRGWDMNFSTFGCKNIIYLHLSNFETSMATQKAWYEFRWVCKDLGLIKVYQHFKFKSHLHYSRYQYIDINGLSISLCRDI